MDNDNREQPAGSQSPASHGSALGWLDPLEDERHIANALYLLQKAVALREREGGGWPTIHACLRDAAEECELARRYWTKEAMQRRDEIYRKIFGEEREEAQNRDSATNSP